VEFVEPQIGQELRRQALYAVLAALGGIRAYVWIRFDFRGGVVTIVSLADDVLVCVGALSLAHLEFSLPVLAALLTMIGFSVNDRIVMYDRLREIRSKRVEKGITFVQQVNLAVNQTSVADRAHRRDGGHVGSDPVPVRRSDPGGLCVRGPGRRPHRQIVDSVRRGGPRRGLGYVAAAATAENAGRGRGPGCARPFAAVTIAQRGAVRRVV
jgi:hypothetical protein